MKKKYWIMLSLIFLFVFSTQLIASADTIKGQKITATLSDVIDRNWPQWSNNQTTVNLQELIDNLANPAYKGEDAAALADLSRYVKKHCPNNQLSLDDVHNIITKDKVLSTQYNIFKKSLRTASHKLYKSGQPDFEAMQQGPEGDCFFFSAVGWLVKYRPQVVEQAIIRLPNNQYQVTFPDGHSVTVNTPTDGEMLFFNSQSTYSDGFWMLILEKAFGMVYPIYDHRKLINSDEPMENIDQGGRMPITQQIWTGHKPDIYNLNKTNLVVIRKKLIDMKNNNLMGQADVAPNPPIPVPGPPAFGTRHAYAVLDFDEQTNLLTMWNPWGTDFTPIGPDSPQNGYTRIKGVFQIPLTDFMSIYSTLVIEHASR